MGHIDGTLNFVTKINTKGFSRGLNTLNGQMNALMGLAGKLASALTAAFSVKKIIESAAEVKALQSQFEQTFGELQGQAQKMIDGVSESAQILDTRLKGTAASIYAFAKTSGMGSTQALELMNDALQVTADSAAYYDRSLEQTGETLMSFLKGNYANDAALGISCTETTRNTAANKLYSKSFQELSESQKQITLLQMVKDANKLSGAMGQAAREADGWENVTGNLKEAWKQLLAAVGQPVLALAVPVVKRLTSVIQTLTAAARDAAQALSQVFGINMDSADSTADIAASSGESAKNYESIAESAEEAADANERSLMSFDQINKIGGDENPAAEAEIIGTGEALSPIPDLETDKAESKLTAFFAGVKKGFDAAFKPLKSAWNTCGEPFVNSAEAAFESLKGLLSDAGKSFAEVWTNGTGEEILEHHIGIVQNLISLVGNLAESFRTAWNTDNLGTDIIQGAADIWNTVSGHAETFTDILSEWAAQVDFTPLLTSLKELETALEPLADTVGEGLERLLENVLLPLAEWTLEEAVPAAADAFSAALDTLRAAAKALKKPAKWLWDKFLKPLSEWTGEIITSGLEALSDILNDIGDWIDKNPDSAAFFMALTTAVLGLNAAANAGGIAALAGKLKAAVSSLASLNVTVGVIIAGIAGWTYAITEISNNWDDIAEVIEQDGGIFGFISGWIESCTKDITLCDGLYFADQPYNCKIQLPAPASRIESPILWNLKISPHVIDENDGQFFKDRYGK